MEKLTVQSTGCQEFKFITPTFCMFAGTKSAVLCAGGCIHFVEALGA
jgi:hypothetical protein